VIGDAKKDEYKLRSQAKVGDGIYVSGVVGAAAVGFAYLQKKKMVGNHFIQAFKNPRPRLQLAKILSEISEVHAVIDLSDGLLQDLGHVAKLSEVGAKINLRDVPKAPDFEKACQELKLNPVETLLSGGEDYQLLFTMSARGASILDQKLSHLKNLRITRIGDSVGKDHSVKVFDDAHQEIKLKKPGFDHFG
jgi:thiamine-monophosphate kinase